MIHEHEMERDVKTMSKSMLIVMVFTMVSKITGYLREILLASQYGRTMYADAYTYAQDLPCIVLSVIVAAVSATLIPVFSSRLKEGQEKANRFICNLLTIGTLLSVAVVLLTLLFLDEFATLYIPDAEEEVRALVIRLARIMMPMGLFVFLARISSAYLQANFRFTVPALSACCLNFVVIAAIVVSRGENITYVALGTLLGWMLQFAVQIPSMRRTNLRYRPVLDFREPGLREVLVLMLPVLVSSAFDQVYLFFDRSIVSGVVGEVTALSYGNRISTMVSSVLLTTIATILYPNLVKHVDEPNKLRDDLSFGVNLNLLIAIPAMVALVMLCQPITQLVYQRGKFGAEDTLVTAGTLACYSCGILGVGLRELCNRCLYAFKDTKVPTIVGVIAVLMNIVLNYALYPLLGVSGVSLATAISSLTSGSILLVILHRRRKVVDGPRVLRCLWKTLAGSAVMALVLFALSQALDIAGQEGGRFYLSMAILFVSGVGAYVAVLALLKTEELRMALRMVTSRFRRR